MFIYQLLSAVFLFPIFVGIMAVMLSYARTGSFGWKPFSTGFRKKWGDCFLLGIWPSVILNVFLAFPFLYILFPVWLAVTLWMSFTALSLAEEGIYYSQAVSGGLNLVTGSFWMAILFQLLVILINCIGILACCVGVFFSGALAQLLIAIGYNNLARANSQGNPSY
ncbi:MAG: hypothetical protein QME62_03515 [Armatimonadota bacterium]|nr:hypothetical protein [Armatimonadota bacterium]